VPVDDQRQSNGCRRELISSPDQIDFGDNLSERLHIQNSISLTIPMLPRIIAPSTSTKREPVARSE
jgi:hypothetical protein